MMLTTEAGAALTVLDSPPRRGGEACVYEARDGEGRRLAVKVALLPLPAGGWLDQERARLEDVARDPAVAGRVVQVRHHGLWGDRPFLAMDWCADTLASVAPEADPERRLRLAIEVCRAVQALHDARPGLVHRDLKPTNVLLDGETIRLADFGSAREHRPGQTTTTSAFFTPGWSPPEQALPLRQRPERSWDVYALAATVFFTLVGAPPDAPAANARCLTVDGTRLLAGAIPDPDGPPMRWLDFARMNALSPTDRARLRAAGVGPEVERALMQAMAPRPGQRRGTAGTLADALAAPPATRSVRRIVAVGSLAGAVVATVAAVWLARGPAVDPYAVARIPAGPGVAAFELGIGEVRQSVWREVTGLDPAEHRARQGGSVGARCGSYEGIPMVGDHLPVLCVSFYDVLAFANALSIRDGLAPAYTIRPREGLGVPDVTWDPDANGWRLPTDAEWMHAVAAGGAVPRVEAAAACALGNFGDRRAAGHFARFPSFVPFPCDDGYLGPAPIDSHPANAWGIRELLGNATEWVWTDRDAEDRRGGRGLGWVDSGDASSLVRQGWFPADDRLVYVGFRVARNAR